MSKHSLLSAQVGAIKAARQRPCVSGFQACVYMCFLNLFRMEMQRSAGAHKPVSCVTRTRRWPADMVASFEDPQTNHCFKGHFKRCSDRRADGAWKKKKKTFIPHLQTFSLVRSLFQFCDAWKCCARICKNAAAGSDGYTCENWKWSLRPYLCRRTSAFFHPD